MPSLSKIHLADQAMRPLTGGLPPRIAVASLNPHAGEDGLFGDEEQDDHRARPSTGAAARGSTFRDPFPTTRSSIMP